MLLRAMHPTSDVESLTCSLRAIFSALLGIARACKSPISKPLSLLRLALCCTVLRSRWCQSGVNLDLAAASYSPVLLAALKLFPACCTAGFLSERADGGMTQGHPGA